MFFFRGIGHCLKLRHCKMLCDRTRLTHDKIKRKMFTKLTDCTAALHVTFWGVVDIEKHHEVTRVVTEIIFPHDDSHDHTLDVFSLSASNTYPKLRKFIEDCVKGMGYVNTYIQTIKYARETLVPQVEIECSFIISNTDTRFCPTGRSFMFTGCHTAVDQWEPRWTKQKSTSSWLKWRRIEAVVTTSSTLSSCLIQSSWQIVMVSSWTQAWSVNLLMSPHTANDWQNLKGVTWLMLNQRHPWATFTSPNCQHSTISGQAYHCCCVPSMLFRARKWIDRSVPLEYRENVQSWMKELHYAKTEKKFKRKKASFKSFLSIRSGGYGILLTDLVAFFSSLGPLL